MTGIDAPRNSAELTFFLALANPYRITYVNEVKFVFTYFIYTCSNEHVLIKMRNNWPEHSEGENDYREMNRILQTKDHDKKPPKPPEDEGGFGCIWILFAIALCYFGLNSKQSDEHRPSRVTDPAQLEQSK